MMFGASTSDIVVVAAAFFMNAFTMGPVKSFGPFFIRFEQDLEASAGQSSLAMSLLYGGFFAVGPFSSVMSNRFGFRKVMLLGGTVATFGAIACAFSRSILLVNLASVMTGIGCGFSVVPTFAILGQRFQEKRSLANNIMTMGSAFMAIPLAPLVQFWIYEYTWRGAILLLGGLFMNIIPNGLILTRDVGSSAKKEWKISELKIVKSFSFPCYLITCGTDLAAMVCVSVYLVRYTQSKGIDDYLAASLSSVLAIVDLCLRPFSGYFTSLSHLGRIAVIRPYVFAIIAVLQAIVVTMFTACEEFYAIVAVSVAYAVCIGSRGALSVTLATEFFGTSSLVTVLGLRSLSLGIFSASVPSVIGSIVDACDSYRVPFYASAIMSLISAAGAVIVHKLVSKISNSSDKRVSQTNEESKLDALAPNEIRTVGND